MSILMTSQPPLYTLSFSSAQNQLIGFSCGQSRGFSFFEQRDSQLLKQFQCLFGIVAGGMVWPKHNVSIRMIKVQDQLQMSSDVLALVALSIK